MNVRTTTDAVLHQIMSRITGRRSGSADFRLLHERLNRHHHIIRQSLHTTHRHARKLFRKHNLTFHNLKSVTTRATAGAALAGTLFVAPVQSSNPKPLNPVIAQAGVPQPSVNKLAGPDNPTPQKLTEAAFAAKIKEIMGNSTTREGKLGDAQLEQIKKLIKEQFDIEIDNKTPDGFQFREDFGMTGAEQHLPRYAGDNAAAHASPDDPLATLAGITHGKGAWGYVPSSKSNGTENKEKWYVVGRTMDSAQFGTSASKNLGGQQYLTIQIPRDFEGDHTFVGVGELWDAGPGRSTGKIWGHSPEYWYHFGEAAGRSRKTQIIMLPLTKETPVSQEGPQNFAAH